MSGMNEPQSRKVRSDSAILDIVGQRIETLRYRKKIANRQ